KYEKRPQPRIVDVNVNFDIFPETRDFKAVGSYILVNKTDQIIDLLFVDHNDYDNKFTLNKPSTLVSEDTLFNFNIYRLGTPLAPGDSIRLTFEVRNKPNSILKDRSPILENGTFVN